VGFYWSPKVDVLEVQGDTLQYSFSPDTTGAGRGASVDFRAVAWSSDGSSLYAGGGHAKGWERQIRKWTDGGRGRYRDLPAQSHDQIEQIVPLRAGGVAYSAYDGSFGVLDAQNNSAIFVRPALVDHRVAMDDFRLSQDGSIVQFAYDVKGDSQAFFSVNERRLTDASNLWAGLKEAFTLQAPITEGLGVSDWRTSQSPKLKGNPLPVKETTLSLAVKPDRSGFVLGTLTHLRLFDSLGKELWGIPVSGAARKVNTNGTVAVAAHADGTIRWYRMSDGKEMLAFFPHPDRKRWVLWTPSGYYAASPGGEDLIGWHVNNGKDKAADFYPASRFRSEYLRPDVIDKILAAADEAEAIRLANLESGRARVESVSIREKLPPLVTILAPVDGSEVDVETVNIRYSTRSQEPITSVKVLVDGRPMSRPGGVKSSDGGGEFSVTIPQRDCEVSVVAENVHASSEPANIRLRWRGTVAKREDVQSKPRLYVLAVGVSEYQKPDLRLNLAAKDALDFAGSWADQKGKLYSSVDVRMLTDAQATKANILNGMRWIREQVGVNDVAIFFFAGHGLDDNDGIFHFFPVDADPQDLKSTGVPQSDIVAAVSSIAGKVLLFMDACHSGNLLGSIKRRGGRFDINAVINELASAENGAVVFSSSTGRQYSLENPEWGNGAFTKGVVEGIGGKADFRGTGRITVAMLDLYVSERVKELTQGQQTPTTVKPPNVPDFPVAVLR
jgi:WD40 repeat protein